MRGGSDERQEWRPVRSSRLNRWNWDIYPRDNFRLKNRRCDEILSCCHIYVVWECCAMKFGWLKWAWTMKNWWIHGDWGHVQGFCPIFMMHLNTLFGDILMNPHDTKNRPMSCHHLMLPRWHDIGWIFVSWGYIMISPNNTSTGTVKNDDNHEHHCNSDEFISSWSLALI